MESELNYILRGYAVASKSAENYYTSVCTHYLYETVEYLYQLIPFSVLDPKINEMFHKARKLEHEAKELEGKVGEFFKELRDEINIHGEDYNKLLEHEDSLRRQDEREDT